MGVLGSPSSQGLWPCELATGVFCSMPVPPPQASTPWMTVKPLARAVLQVGLGLLPRVLGEERPGRVAQPEEGRAGAVDEVPAVRAHLDGPGNARGGDGGERKGGGDGDEGVPHGLPSSGIGRKYRWARASIHGVFASLVTLIGFLALVAVGVVSLGVWLSGVSRKRRQAAEAEMLARLGGRLGQDSMHRPVIEVTVEGREVRLTRVETSRSRRTWFEVRVSSGDLGFDVRPRRSQFVATLGPTLVVTGDAAFDGRLLAMSPERSRLGAVLTPEVRRRLVEQEDQGAPFWWRLQKGVLRGEVHGSWGSSGFPGRCDAALAVLAGLAREIERPPALVPRLEDP